MKGAGDFMRSVRTESIVFNFMWTTLRSSVKKAI